MTLIATAAIDDIAHQIADTDRELTALGADHLYVSTPLAHPGNRVLRSVWG